MTDETSTTQNTTPDAAENTDAGTQHAPPMIPKARFDEINKRMKDAERLAADLQQKQTEREEADRLAKGEHEKIIAELKPEAEAAKKFRQTLEKIYQAELQAVPEDMRDLIPDMEISARIEFLQKLKSRGIFAKPVPPITDAGAQGTPVVAAKLTDEERAAARAAGMTDEQYAKYKSTT